MKKTLVISLGGSIIAPKPGIIDILFIKRFHRLVMDFVRQRKYRVIVVTGGGKLNKEYNQAVKKITKPATLDLDLLGIAATKFHAEFIRVIFGTAAHPEILLNPKKRLATVRPIICAAGWKPGCSTDKDAVLLAITYRSNVIINLTNVDYVYTKDPTRHNDAERVTDIDWRSYRKLIPKKWSPRLSTPFDPVASRLAEKHLKTVHIINGRRLGDIRKALAGEKFHGTAIHS